MLSENAEAKIKEWVEVSIRNMETLLDLHVDGEDANYTLLNLAVKTDEQLSCYWNVYHSTCTEESYDDELWDRILKLRVKLNSLRPGF